VSMFDRFVKKAAELLEQGEPFVTASVVRFHAPISGKPGDKAIIFPDGKCGLDRGWLRATGSDQGGVESTGRRETAVSANQSYGCSGGWNPRLHHDLPCESSKAWRSARSACA